MKMSLNDDLFLKNRVLKPICKSKSEFFFILDKVESFCFDLLTYCGFDERGT
jgi:hypothetical protein